jgi:hypothetical protein
MSATDGVASPDELVLLVKAVEDLVVADAGIHCE